MLKYNYVINLIRRPDRWEQFLKKRDKTILKEEKFIRFAAFDGFDYENEIKRFGIENHVIFRFMKQIKLSVPKGVLGCLMSHLMLLQEIINNKDIEDNDYVGIYEDDIFYCDDFDKKYNEFKKINLSNYNVDFIYLGGRFAKNFDCRYSDDFNLMFEKQDNPNLIKRKQMIYRNFNWDRCTFSFVIRKSICKKLMEIISTLFVKKEGGIIKFEAIDYVYTCAFNKINMFDFMPHLYYSPVNYNTDIQGNHLTNVIQF
jgi:GR25 family glycosyltransferase involved in LPS biosynthesis